ncbi:MAG: ABC transporter substrate-binding protein [Candidatus Rokuibacteriota bacterium]
MRSVAVQRDAGAAPEEKRNCMKDVCSGPARWRLARAAVALLALAACTPSSPPPAVRVGTIGSIDELPLFVIQERALDGKHGLRLETSTHPSGARIIEAMAAGSLDAAWSVGTVPLLDAAERGVVPGRIVAVATNAVADPERPGIGVVVAPTVDDWRNLGGKLIGVYAVNSLGGAALRARLNHERVESYRLVEIALPNLGLALAGGAVAAVAMPEPFVTQSTLRNDGKLLGWVIGGPPLERMVYTVLGMRSQFVRERREVTKAVLRAHLDAVAWINANPEQARMLMARRLGISDDLGRRLRLLSWPPDGRHDAVLFSAMQGVLIEIGLVGAPIPASRVFDSGALEDVLGERQR